MDETDDMKTLAPSILSRRPGASHQTGWTGVVARLMHLFATTSAGQVLELGKAAAHVDLDQAVKRTGKTKLVA